MFVAEWQLPGETRARSGSASSPMEAMAGENVRRFRAAR
jgi:hypothetical protein